MQGFDPRVAHEGMGLDGMRERLAMVDGRLKIKFGGRSRRRGDAFGPRAQPMTIRVLHRGRSRRSPEQASASMPSAATHVVVAEADPTRRTQLFEVRADQPDVPRMVVDASCAA